MSDYEYSDYEYNDDKRTFPEWFYKEFDKLEEEIASTDYDFKEVNYPHGFVRQNVCAHDRLVSPGTRPIIVFFGNSRTSDDYSMNLYAQRYYNVRSKFSYKDNKLQEFVYPDHLIHDNLIVRNIPRDECYPTSIKPAESETLHVDVTGNKSNATSLFYNEVVHVGDSTENCTILTMGDAITCHQIDTEFNYGKPYYPDDVSSKYVDIFTVLDDEGKKFIREPEFIVKSTTENADDLRNSVKYLYISSRVASRGDVLQNIIKLLTSYFPNLETIFISKFALTKYVPHYNWLNLEKSDAKMSRLYSSLIDQKRILRSYVENPERQCAYKASHSSNGHTITCTIECEDRPVVYPWREEAR